MSLTASYIVLLAGIAVAAACFRIAVRLYRADKVESRKSAARVHSVGDALRGRAQTHVDFLPDARVKAGMVFNPTEKRIELSGRLSTQSLERIYS